MELQRCGCWIRCHYVLWLLNECIQYMSRFSIVRESLLFQAISKVWKSNWKEISPLLSLYIHHLYLCIFIIFFLSLEFKTSQFASFEQNQIFFLILEFKITQVAYFEQVLFVISCTTFCIAKLSPFLLKIRACFDPKTHSLTTPNIQLVNFYVFWQI